MNKIVIGLFICLLFSSTLAAQETKNSHLAAKFAEVLGFENMLNNIKVQAQQSADQQFSQMMDQLKKSFSNMPPQYMQELREAGADFTKKASSGWDAVEASRIYTSALADTLPEDELRKSIAHYSTIEGKKQLNAIYEASAKLNAYILSSSQKASQDATQEFINRIKFIAEKAKRDREKNRESKNKAQHENSANPKGRAAD